MKILEDERGVNGGWITAIIDGRWTEAKIYNDPSTYGVNNGRVSKIAIGKNATRDALKPFFDQMDFNYDRGEDFDYLPAGVLDSIIEQLEALPKVHE